MKRAEFGKEPEETPKATQAVGPAGPKSVPAIEYMAEHTVTANDTLGSIALKYYGSAARENWMPIYESNKALIGDNPAVLRVGQVLKIPTAESV